MRDFRKQNIGSIFICFLVCIMLAMYLSGCASVFESDKPTRTVWLSSLDLEKMTSGWGRPQQDKSVQSQPLRIGGTSFDRGVGTHARSVMHVNLKRSCRKFTAQVGVDDEVGSNRGSVCFRIYADGKLLFDSGTMKAGDDPKPVEVDLTRRKNTVLVVDPTDDNVSYDHADWAEAAFAVAGPDPEVIDVPVVREKKVILTPKPGPKPQINGPKVYGCRPGRPFIYRIPCTGSRPMTCSAENLPPTLTLDTTTGIITGMTPSERGEYHVTLKAANRRGSTQRPFKIVVGDSLALTPPMGWNSWYIHYNRVTERHMRNAADAMIASGMADAGYMYVNIDDCWMKKRGDEPYRGADKAVLTNAKFPDIKGMVDYIHSKGLRAGTYISPGPWTCAGYVGSYQHEQIDAEKFAEWGFDFLKYDWCSYGQIYQGRMKQTNDDLLEKKHPYRQMGDILKQLDRDILLNLCQYGMSNVWQWGGEVGGHCWRTTGDLGLAGGADLPGFYHIAFSNAQHWQYAKPGQWNDPDYILIGWVGNAHGMGEGKPTALTSNEQYSYMSMWCLMAAPLIFSGDMEKLGDFTLNILCNAEVIEVDQDPLGKQAPIIRRTNDYFIMAKDMEDGSKAVGLFNTSQTQSRIFVTWTDLGIEGPYRIRDLWRQKNLGTYRNLFETKVPRHGVTLVRLFPASTAATVTPAPAFAGVNSPPRKRGAGAQSREDRFPLSRE
jgi:alpha-galactosidase